METRNSACVVLNQALKVLPDADAILGTLEVSLVIVRVFGGKRGGMECRGKKNNGACGASVVGKRIFTCFRNR